MLSPCCTFGTPQAHGIVPKKLELGVSELFPKCGAKNILEVLLNQVSKPRSWTGGGESWDFNIFFLCWVFLAGQGSSRAMVVGIVVQRQVPS